MLINVAVKAFDKGIHLTPVSRTCAKKKVMICIPSINGPVDEVLRLIIL